MELPSLTLAKPKLFAEFASTLKSVGFPIFIWMILGGGLDQWLTERMQKILSDPDGLSNWIWAYGFASVVVSMVFPMITLLWIVNKKTTLSGITQLLIESLRAWGKAMTWGFLLIIPGVIQWLKLSFVPFVTLESQTYARGEIDALETSRKLSKGHLWHITGLMMLFSVLLPLLLTTWDEERMIWNTPLASLTLTLIETVFTILFFLILRRLYQAAAEKISLT
jgi:hypothetical protein